MIKKTVAALALTAVVASADRIVVNHDEWTLSNAGFGASSGADEFTVNVANWLTAGTGDNDILILSSNFAYGSTFVNTLTTAGYSVTHNTSGASNIANWSDYEAVFVAGNPVNQTALTSYVNNGGNVYVAGGTGWYGSVQEAANWNTFLNSFGLGFGTTYNGIGGTLAAPSANHEILNGVSNLYFDNGNTAIDLVVGGTSQVIWNHGGRGLVAVYDGNPAAIPEPGTLALMGLGLGGLALVARRRKK